MPITTRRTLLAASVGVGASAMQSAPRLARAQAANTVRIGVLNDQSGLYRDITGPTAVACTRQAIAGLRRAARASRSRCWWPTTRTGPMSACNIARQWFDRDGVDMIVDVPNSAVALAVSGVAREKNRVCLNTSAATADLTGPQCSPNTVHWTFDTWMLAKSTGGAMVKAGGDTWFFVTADYAFGHALERDTTNFVRASRRPRTGQRAHALPGHHGLLLLPGAGAGQPRQGDRPRQRRRRHHQLRQAGGRVRPDAARHQARRRC